LSSCDDVARGASANTKRPLRSRRRLPSPQDKSAPRTHHNLSLKSSVSKSHPWRPPAIRASSPARTSPYIVRTASRRPPCSTSCSMAPPAQSRARRQKDPRPRPVGAFTGQPSSYVRLRALARVPGQYWRANGRLRPEFIDCPRVVRHAAHPLTGFRSLGKSQALREPVARTKVPLGLTICVQARWW